MTIPKGPPHHHIKESVAAFDSRLEEIELTKYERSLIRRAYNYYLSDLAKIDPQPGPWRGPQEDDWDSYGGKPTTATATEAVNGIADAMRRGQFRIVPTVSGGAQIDGLNPVDWEIEISPDGEEVLEGGDGLEWLEATP